MKGPRTYERSFGMSQFRIPLFPSLKDKKSYGSTHVSLEAPACLHVRLAEFAGESDSFVDLLLGKLVFQTLHPLVVALEGRQMKKLSADFEDGFPISLAGVLQFYDSETRFRQPKVTLFLRRKWRK